MERRRRCWPARPARWPRRARVHRRRSTVPPMRDSRTVRRASSANSTKGHVACSGRAVERTRRGPSGGNSKRLNSACPAEEARPVPPWRAKNRNRPTLSTHPCRSSSGRRRASAKSASDAAAILTHRSRYAAVHALFVQVLAHPAQPAFIGRTAPLAIGQRGRPAEYAIRSRSARPRRRRSWARRRSALRSASVGLPKVLADVAAQASRTEPNRRGSQSPRCRSRPPTWSASKRPGRSARETRLSLVIRRSFDLLLRPRPVNCRQCYARSRIVKNA